MKIWVEIQKLMIAHVLSILVAMVGALCSFNLVRKYKQYLRSVYPLMPKLGETVAGASEICLCKSGVERIGGCFYFTNFGRKGIFACYGTTYQRAR